MHVVVPEVAAYQCHAANINKKTNYMHEAGKKLLRIGVHPPEKQVDTEICGQDAQESQKAEGVEETRPPERLQQSPVEGK